ncbi:hypothetical protein D3C80_1478080 [compost metagenome]
MRKNTALSISGERTRHVSALAFKFPTNNDPVVVDVQDHASIIRNDAGRSAFVVNLESRGREPFAGQREVATTALVVDYVENPGFRGSNRLRLNQLADGSQRRHVGILVHEGRRPAIVSVKGDVTVNGGRCDTEVTLVGRAGQPQRNGRVDQRPTHLRREVSQHLCIRRAL